MRITITTVARGLPLVAQDGDTVSFSLPAGFALRRIRNGDTATVTQSSPFVHSGGEATYRIDRLTTDGQPAEAVLDIVRA